MYVHFIGPHAELENADFVLTQARQAERWACGAVREEPSVRPTGEEVARAHEVFELAGMLDAEPSAGLPWYWGDPQEPAPGSPEARARIAFARDITPAVAQAAETIESPVPVTRAILVAALPHLATADLCELASAIVQQRNELADALEAIRHEIKRGRLRGGWDGVVQWIDDCAAGRPSKSRKAGVMSGQAKPDSGRVWAGVIIRPLLTLAIGWLTQRFWGPFS